jgi:predicted CoA-binding protein
MHTDPAVHLLTSDAQIRSLLQRTRRIAVLGIKPESHADQPAYSVPAFAQTRGFQIVPVPVYYPEMTHILGEPVRRSLSQTTGSIDMVNVFRKSSDVPAHLDELLAAKPASVWMQLGIAHPEVADRLARAGIDVVQNRCLLVEINRLL